MFSAINLSVIGISRQEAFSSLLSVVYPYNESTQNYNFFLLILNVCVGLIFITVIIKTADEQMLMNNYILVRTSRKKAICIVIFRTLKAFAWVYVVKILTDLLFSQMNKTENLLKAVIAELSIFLTIIIWTLCVYAFLQNHIDAKWVYFIVICSAIVLQYFSAYVPFFTLFVFGSPSMRNLSALWLLLKFVLSLMLFFVNIIKAENYEQLNIKNE